MSYLGRAPTAYGDIAKLKSVSSINGRVTHAFFRGALLERADTEIILLGLQSLRSEDTEDRLTDAKVRRVVYRPKSNELELKEPSDYFFRHQNVYVYTTVLPSRVAYLHKEVSAV